MASATEAVLFLSFDTVVGVCLPFYTNPVLKAAAQAIEQPALPLFE